MAQGVTPESCAFALYVPDRVAYSDMRTTLDLNDDLLAALMARHPDLSKTEAIEVAIRQHLAELSVAGLRGFAGRMDIEDISADLRKRDRQT